MASRSDFSPRNFFLPLEFASRKENFFLSICQETSTQAQLPVHINALLSTEWVRLPLLESAVSAIFTRHKKKIEKQEKRKKIA
jgi:hypothetical protein